MPLCSFVKETDCVRAEGLVVRVASWHLAASWMLQRQSVRQQATVLLARTWILSPHDAGADYKASYMARNLNLRN